MCPVMGCYGFSCCLAPPSCDSTSLPPLTLGTTALADEIPCRCNFSCVGIEQQNLSKNTLRLCLVIWWHWYTKSVVIPSQAMSCNPTLVPWQKPIHGHVGPALTLWLVFLVSDDRVRWSAHPLHGTLLLLLLLHICNSVKNIKELCEGYLLFLQI